MHAEPETWAEAGSEDEKAESGETSDHRTNGTEMEELDEVETGIDKRVEDEGCGEGASCGWEDASSVNMDGAPNSIPVLARATSGAVLSSCSRE